jgi:uncharacterized protein involved in response to NO
MRSATIRTLLGLAAGIGALLAVASVLGLIRLARWRGLKTTAEPLVLILHVGYLWLVLALAALNRTTMPAV